MLNPTIPVCQIKSIQYNAALAITGAIRGASKEKLYQDLGLESLKDRRWLRPTSYLYKIISIKLPSYLYELIPPLQRSHRYPGCFQTFRCRTTFFQDSFYHLSLLNGINWILILKMLIPIQFSAKSFWLL